MNEIGLSEQKSFVDKSQNAATGSGNPSVTRAGDGDNEDERDSSRIVQAIAWVVLFPTLLITLRAEVYFRISLAVC